MNSKASRILGIESGDKPPSSPTSSLKSFRFRATNAGRKNTSIFGTGRGLPSSNSGKARISDDKPPAQTSSSSHNGRPRDSPGESVTNPQELSLESQVGSDTSTASSISLGSFKPASSKTTYPQDEAKKISAFDLRDGEITSERQPAQRTKAVPARLLLHRQSLGTQPPSPPPKTPLPQTPDSARQSSNGAFLTSQGLYWHGAIVLANKRRSGSVAAVGGEFGWETIIGEDSNLNGEEIAMDATVHYYTSWFSVIANVGLLKAPTIVAGKELDWHHAPRLDEIVIHSSAARQAEVEWAEDGNRPGPSIHTRSASSISYKLTPTSVEGELSRTSNTTPRSSKRISTGSLNLASRLSGQPANKRFSMDNITSTARVPKEPDTNGDKERGILGHLWSRMGK